MRGSLAMNMRTGPEKKQNTARMQALMAQNKSLRMDSLSLFYASIFPQILAPFGMHPKLWDAGKVATQDTVSEGLRLQVYQGIPLLTKAVGESVGARKECVRIGYEVVWCANHTAFRSTEQTAEMHQQAVEKTWGKDGSIGTTTCVGYHFDRHFMISQGIGMRQDPFLVFAIVQFAAECWGNVQMMVQLFEKQLGGMREFVKRGVPGGELPLYCQVTAPCLTGLELSVLHPFGKEMAALFESCEGRCVDPEDSQGWFESAEWSAFRAQYGEGVSSKDGLHHMFLKSHIITMNQATLSLSLASMGRSNFDLSWLDHLPAPDDPKLFDSQCSGLTFANLRVLIAEVLEWQGQHKKAIRCAHQLSRSLSLLYYIYTNTG